MRANKPFALGTACLAALFAAFAAAPASAAAGSAPAPRPYVRDLGSASGGPLAPEEREIAEYVLLYHLMRAGQAAGAEDFARALAFLDDESYAKAIAQAARVAKNPAAKGLLAAGEFGEKLLKALIVAAEKAAEAAGDFVEQGAAEYDATRKKP